MTGNGMSQRDHEDLQSLTQEEKAQTVDMPDTKAAQMEELTSRLLRDSNHSGLRDHRSCSDAGVHAVSKSRAAAAAALIRASGGERRSCGRCRQQQQHPLLLHQPHLKHCPLHDSHSSMSCDGEMGCGLNVFSGAKPTTTTTKRSHSQSSIAKLAVKQQTKHASSTPTLSRSRHALSSEKEVTYVWRDGRVQVQQPQAARNGVGYSERHLSFGQHVEYLWHSGNVQRIIRGSNNEMLCAEVVPPRGEVKGTNYCILFCLVVFFVVAIVSLVFVLKVFY